MILETSIKQASKILKKNKISTHYLDAEIILSDLMGVEREFLTINRDKVISNELNHKYLDAIKRRLKGEPVAYITGKKEFWSHNFSLNRSTLVPRPETELMIYKIVKFFKNKKYLYLILELDLAVYFVSYSQNLVVQGGVV
jgi:Methylase of polypeptide chain release factors